MNVCLNCKLLNDQQCAIMSFLNPLFASISLVWREFIPRCRDMSTNNVYK